MCLAVMTFFACLIPTCVAALGCVMFYWSIKFPDGKNTYLTVAYVCIVIFVIVCILFAVYFCTRKRRPNDHVAIVGGLECCGACSDACTACAACGILTAICSET